MARRQTVPLPLTSRLAENIQSKADALKSAKKAIDDLHAATFGLIETTWASPHLRRVAQEISRIQCSLAQALWHWQNRTKTPIRRDRDQLVRDSVPGPYPWEEWERKATDVGIASKVRRLGKKVMYEAYARDWPDDRCVKAGWSDDGAAMLALAATSPNEALNDWNFLLLQDDVPF